MEPEQVTLKLRSVDNRKVIEVKGKYIVLSEIKSDIEDMLSKSEVHEVRIFAGSSLSVDANLSRDVWHGRNLVVLANEINVCTSVTWDVSGKDSDHTYTSNAGTGEDGFGKDGSDGYPGESGGNVSVQTNTIQNSERLIIISNGGNGGCGQDGGNGHDGIDGLGISYENFEEYFPYSSMVSRSDQIARIKKIVQNIYDMSKSVQIEWMKLKSTDNETGDIVEGNLLEHLKDNNYFDIYLHVVTKEGNEILFSLWDETTQCHSFLVYKGSPGQRGKSGGKYGMGGQGGFPGEISVMGLNSRMKFGICSQKTWGNDGTNGAGGLNGSFGQNGWDMGFLGDLTSNATIYGADQNSLLEYTFHDESSSDNVYHPYRAKDGQSDKYVKIQETRIDHLYFIRERNNTIARKERQNHSRAVGKKSVPRMRIVGAYSEYLQEVETERQESKRQRVEKEAEKSQESKRQRIEKEAQEIQKIDKEKQNEQAKDHDALKLEVENQYRHYDCITNLLIKRFENFEQDTTNYNRFELVKLEKMHTNTKNNNVCAVHQDKVGTLKSNFNPDSWLKLQSLMVNLTEVSTLVENFDKLKSRPDAWQGYNYSETAAKLDTIAEILKRKYKFAILEEIAHKLPIYYDKKSKVILSSLQATRYLEETEEQDESIIHSVLGTLKQYIFENTQEQREIFSKFVEKTMKKEQRKTLRSLYDKSSSEEQAKAFWKTVCEDEQKQELFKKNWQQEGILNDSYRVALAYVFDVNLRVYARNENNEIVLKEDHNPKCTTVAHILLKGNEFIQLKINIDYYQLANDRLHKDKVYKRILTEVRAKRKIKSMKHYFEKGLFNHKSSNHFKKFADIDEKSAIGRIAAYFPIEEKELIAHRLKYISLQYTGQHGVFESMLERFSFEGCHMSFNELYFLINSILAHTVDARQERYTFSWIISAYNQCNWTDELVLLQLENCYKRELPNKTKWRSYMSNIHNKEVLLVFVVQFIRKPCSVECVEDILHLLSHVPIESVCLDQLELTEWPYALKEYYWTKRLQSLTTWEDSDNFTSATYFILSIENNHGKDKLEKLFETLAGKRIRLTLFRLNEILKCFHNQKWIMNDDDLEILKDKSLTEWEKHMDDANKISAEELNVSQIAAIIKSNANTSNEIKSSVSKIQVSVENIKQYKIRINDKLISSFTEGDIKEWSETFRNTKTNSSFEKYEQMLAVVDRAVELKRGFRLRDTQLLTVLTLIANDNKTLAQVSTGEGKTLIVVAISLIKGLLGEKVDIITSSPVLAQRDASDNQDIYELFHLSASHNCSKHMEVRKEAYSLNQIMYGDLANFQRDYLLDSFYGKHVLGDRRFETVIVDEVDSMLLDKGNNILYLSHDIAGMDKLESVYVFIWQMVNTPTDLTEDALRETIKRSLLSDMYPSIQKEDIASLDSALGMPNLLELWESLVKSGLMSDSGRLLIEEIDSNMMDKLLSPDFTQYKDRLSFLLLSRIERKTNLKVPNFLKSFVERHLDGWISSALTALYIEPGQYYVVDVDRSGTSADRHANVIILDRDTGTDQANAQWDEALHQFLQLKHGCKLSTLNQKAVFISNVNFFKMYKLLYGLSGTLGSLREKNMLEEIHQVDFVTIPTAKQNRFEEYESIICSDTEKWRECINQEVETLTTTKKRSVLIICETFNDIVSLTQILSSEKQKNVHTYVSGYETICIDEVGLEPGQIIITTNWACRGTNIKISDKLRDAGGLHVLLTYLPSKFRIEEQAYGSTARNGYKGSGRMIIMVTDGDTQDRSLIFTLKKKRNVDELFRLSAIKSDCETAMKTEEDFFKMFEKLYGKQMNLLGYAKTPEPVKEILLESCLNKWAFWLDENNALIRRSSDEASTHQLKLLLDQFKKQFDDLKATDATNWPTWVEGNPIQMIKLAKYIAQNEPKHYETAFELFEKVIENEPHFCEAAYYYRVRTQAVITMNVDELRNDLRMAERLFEEHIKNVMHASAVVRKLKTSTPQNKGYEEQKKNVIDVYSLFINSIGDMLGHAITPDSFVNDEITEVVARTIFEDLVRTGMIKKAEVVGNVSDALLQNFHSVYEIPMDQLKEFLAKHMGCIDEKELLGAIRRSFSIPSRSEFWETLVQQNVLHSVEEYVAINEKRLEAEKSDLMSVITYKVEKRELVKEAVKLEKNQILLFHEDDSLTHFDKKKFIGVVGQMNLANLKEEGLLSFNKKATIDKSKIADCVFSTFDSITAEDITNKTRITTNEANIIIDELLKQNFLEKRGESYALSDNLDQEILLPPYPVYENVIKRVLESCFAYRSALRNTADQLEDRDCSAFKIPLERNPHRMFFNDLLEQKIIQPCCLSETVDINMAVDKVCSNQRISMDSAAATHIKNVLNRSKPVPAAQKKRNGNLRSIFDLFGKGNFGNIDEMRIFITNGLEHMLEIEEKKWTVEMMSNITAMVLKDRARAFQDIRLMVVDVKQSRDTRCLQNKPEQKIDRPNMIVETKHRLTEEYERQLVKFSRKPPSPTRNSDCHLREKSNTSCMGCWTCFKGV